MRTSPDTAKFTPFLKVRDGQCKDIVAYENNDPAKAICCGEATAPARGRRGELKIGSWCALHRSLYIYEPVR